MRPAAAQRQPLLSPRPPLHQATAARVALLVSTVRSLRQLSHLPLVTTARGLTSSRCRHRYHRRCCHLRRWPLHHGRGSRYARLPPAVGLVAAGPAQRIMATARAQPASGRCPQRRLRRHSRLPSRLPPHRTNRRRAGGAAAAAASAAVAHRLAGHPPAAGSWASCPAWASWTWRSESSASWRWTPLRRRAGGLLAAAALAGAQRRRRTMTPTTRIAASDAWPAALHLLSHFCRRFSCSPEFKRK